LLVVPLVLLVAVALTSCSSGKSHPSTSPPTTVKPAYPRDDTLRLDQVQVLGSHNSYHARPYAKVLAGLRANNPGLADSLDYDHAPLPEQFESLGVRQIELDVWDDPDGGKYLSPQYPVSLGVKVSDDPAMHKPGYKVIHQAGIDTNSTCLTFVACLQLVKKWSDANPGHVPMEIQVEMKDGDVTEPMFKRLEREILSVFDRSNLITPDDVRGSAATLGDAVRTNGWPTLGKVRGRVWFALDNEGFRDAYLKGHPSLKGRLLFTPSAPGEDDAAFAKLNDPIADAAKIKAALAAHMIVRTRADADTFNARANDTHQREAALSGGAQLVSTDYERPDPTLKNGYVVRLPGGTPARCDPVTAPPGCTPSDVEDPALLKIRAR
jgi:hypothetical protein